MRTYLIYGANGYSAALIAREAVLRGQRPILAGRNADAVTALARQLGLDSRIFPLTDPAAVDAGLRDVAAVLHCAGPFMHTARAMADACLRCRVHYLDITGEIGVYEQLARRDAEAKTAGVMLLPGAGFDVVPTDCLAAHLKRRLPTATKLCLGFLAQGRFSRGTATTMTENLGHGGAIRRGGVIQRVPAAWRVRRIDFGDGKLRPAMTIPWGDVATAYCSTGIPDIEVYLAAPASVRLTAWLSRYVGWLLGSRPVQNYLKRRIQAGPPGPSDEERARGRTFVWGEASDGIGRRVVSRLSGPEGYTLTMLTALAIMERVLTGEAPPGFQTPARAYGADFILQIPGVTRMDVS
jgi:short subunit dehydrogenase-like uncharacterized protein